MSKPTRPTASDYRKLVKQAQTLSALVRNAVGALMDLCDTYCSESEPCFACRERWSIEKVWSTIPRFSIGVRVKKGRKR